MGISFSDLKSLKDNELLNTFLSRNKISHTDPYWNNFISFEYIQNYSKNESENIFEIISNSEISYINLFELIQFFDNRFKEISNTSNSEIYEENSIYLKQICNCLFILRLCIHHYLYKNKSAEFEEGKYAFEKVAMSIISTVTDVSLNNLTIIIHMEVFYILNLILYHDVVYNEGIKCNEFYDEKYYRKYLQRVLYFIMESTELNNINVPSLGQNLINPSQNSLTKSLLRYISLGYFSYPNYDFTVPIQLFYQGYFLFLLRLFIFHNKRKSVQSFISVIFTDKSNNDTNSQEYTKVLEYLENNLSNDVHLLYFYILLYNNAQFRNFILERESFSKIVLSLLEILYSHNTRNKNSVYISIILLLILTESDHFNARINIEIVTDLHWIKEKHPYNSTLASLVVWVLCRLLQNNLVNDSDSYFQTNCLATLANMSSKFIGLHSQTCIQMTQLVVYLQKKRLVLIEQSDLNDKLVMIEEALQMLLEIINGSIIFSLTNNADMIHTFLYHKSLFSSLKSVECTKIFASNIESILCFFSSKLESEVGLTSSDYDVINIIKKYATVINKFNNFKNFSRLKFKYVEEDSSGDFFIGYIRQILFNQLFSAQTINENVSNMHLQTTNQ